MKKRITRTLGLALVLVFLAGLFPVGMPVVGADDSLNVSVTTSGSLLSIGNALIQRNIDFSGGKVATASIENKRSGITLTPGAGSEDFILHVNTSRNASADPVAAQLIKAGELTFTGAPRVNKTGGTTLVSFAFAPFVKYDIPWSVTYNIAMNDGDNFMNSFLEISVPTANHAAAHIISIDLDALNIVGIPNAQLWTCASGVATRWGQPVYINSLFFGIEFPLTDLRLNPYPATANNGQDKTLVMRYYSGKNFTELKTNAAGQFVSWPAVVGAARTNEYPVVQDDFYEYVYTFVQGADFRTQYNTWYDGGMLITPQSVAASFMGLEEGVTKAGQPPMDSYVLDDGINDYSGPFWGFKPAFANDAIKDLSVMLNDVGGAFGMWIGPAGGYGDNQGPYMAAAGTGFQPTTSGRLCVAAPKYQENLKKMEMNRMDLYNVNYWKTDGMNATCDVTTHGHIVGGTVTGEARMYFRTELWENITAMFTELKAHQHERGKDVFINLTIGTVPSPWTLKYVNTCYIITNSDDGRAGPTTANFGAQRTTFRDNRYWQFYADRNYQIPYPLIWNHDPIYAEGAENTFQPLSDAQFRDYMYANAMRGPRVWEMLFSPNIFTEQQWIATNEVLNFAQEYKDILKNTRMIANWGQVSSGNTEAGVNPYAYSAWVEDEGFVSFRNPKAATPVTVSLTLDLAAGVKRGMKDLSLTYVTPKKIDAGIVQNRQALYSFGDTITVTLQPLEMVILHFGKVDNAPPSVLRTEVMDANTLRVFFNEAVEVAGDAVVAGHAVTGAALNIDCQSVDIKVSNAFADNEPVVLTSLAVRDLSGNLATVTATARYAAGRLISQFTSAADLTGTAKVAYDDLLQSNVLFLDKNTVGLAASADQTNKLTVASLIHTTGADATVLEQAGAYSVGIDEDGKIVFTVGDLSVTSKTAINDGTWHHFTCVKEPNEMLKIYIDGKINASVYNDRTLNVLQAGAVAIGSPSFTGELSQIAIYNKAVGYKEVAEWAAQPLFEYSVSGNNAFTVAGLAPRLPGTLQARYDTTEYFRNYIANWDDIDAADYAAPGKAAISGTLPGFGGLAVNGSLSVISAWPANTTLMGTNLTTVLDGMKANGWEILNETTADLAVNASGLAITARPGRTMMDRGNIDPTYPLSNGDINNLIDVIVPGVVNENFFLTDPGLDDYCVTVGVNGRPTARNHASGLIFRQDDDNYVRMTWRVSGNATNLNSGVAPGMFSLNVKQGDYDYTLEVNGNFAGFNTSVAQAYLALDKTGDYYTGYYSRDGVNWIKLGTLEAALETPKAGFLATQGIRAVTNFSPNNYSPRFSNFRILQNSVGLTIPADTAGVLNQLWGYDSPRYIWADTTFSDGSEGSLLVDLPLGLDTSVPGATYNVTGTVAGSTRTIPVTVNILPTDWTGVGNAIALFESLKKADWTAASWAAALPFYNAAVAAYGDPTIKQYDADAIEEALLAAIDALAPVIRELWLDAFVYQYPGNKNDLTITVFEVWTDGVVYPVTQTITISNNAAGTYSVGPYKVYVNTKGNDQIRELYLVTPPKLPTETGVRPS